MNIIRMTGWVMGWTLNSFRKGFAEGRAKAAGRKVVVLTGLKMYQEVGL